MRRALTAFLLVVSSRLSAQAGSDFDAIALTRRGSASALVSTADPRPFAMVSVGGAHGCGLSIDKRIWCWGTNNAGQLGGGRIRDANPAPIVVAGARQFSAVNAGAMHTCALTLSGAAECWGYDASGELGSSIQSDDCGFGPCSSVPRIVEGTPDFESISAGHRHTCAVAGGRVWCWGNNERGQAGPRASALRCVAGPCASPQRLDGVSDVVAVSAGGEHSCALGVDGRAWCWGDNRYGQLGIGQPTVLETVSPTRVVTDLRFTTLATGAWHTCGLTVAGTIACWGDGRAGQLGADRATRTDIPLEESTRQRWVSLDAGARTTCAVSATREAWCWGLGTNGRLGAAAPEVCDDGPCARVAVRVPVPASAKHVAVGGTQACAVWTDRMRCWGP